MFGAYGRKLFGAVAGFGSAQDGAIAILLAILLPVLVGGMAIAIDLSRAANLQTELQDVADAAALAGATQLDHTAGARDRAIQAAAVEATRLVENSQRFGDSFEDAVEIDDSLAGNTDIKFFSDLASKTLATTDDTANFIEVNVAPRTLTYLFAGFMDAIDANPSARAVAGYDELACPSQPMFICNPDEPGGAGNPNAPFDGHGYKGFGLTIDNNRSGFVRAGGITGPDQACEDIGRITSTNLECLDTAVDGSGRNVSEIGECVNLRLDIYPDDASGFLGPTTRTDSAFAPAVNVVKGLVHPDQTTSSPFTIPSSESCEINNEWGSPVAAYLGPGQHTSANLPDTMTYPHDDCAYGGTPCELGDGVWDIGTYAATQHSDEFSSTDPGVAGPAMRTAVNAWLTAQDLDFNDDGNDPGDLPTRYEVYLWEVNNDDPQTPDANASCSTELAPVGEERRVITVAVVNCNAGGVVNGFFADAPLARPSAVDLFLTEPLGASDSDSYYVEMIEPSVARKRVVLYE